MDHESTFRTLDPDTANATVHLLKLRGAKRVTVKNRDGFYEVQYFGSPELARYGRHGACYAGNEDAFIVNYYLSGYPLEYISEKTKRHSNAIAYRLRRFRLYAIDNQNRSAERAVRAIGILLSNYKSFAKAAPEVIAALRIQENDYVGLLNEPVHKIVIRHIYEVIQRSDIYDTVLFDIVRNYLLQIPELGNVSYSLIRHYDRPNHKYNEIQPIHASALDSVVVPFDITFAKKALNARLLKSSVNNVVDHFHLGHKRNESLHELFFTMANKNPQIECSIFYRSFKICHDSRSHEDRLNELFDLGDNKVSYPIWLASKLDERQSNRVLDGKLYDAVFDNINYDRDCIFNELIDALRLDLRIADQVEHAQSTCPPDFELRSLSSLVDTFIQGLFEEMEEECADGEEYGQHESTLLEEDCFDTETHCARTTHSIMKTGEVNWMTVGQSYGKA